MCSPPFRIRSLVLLLSTLLAVACGDDDPAEVVVDEVVGTYILQTIDDQPLPQVVDQDGEDMVEITGGTVILAADGTFSDVTQLRVTQGGVVTTPTDNGVGTWTRNGTSVRFALTDGSGFTYTMTWDGVDGLTQLIQPPGVTLVYSR